MSKMSDLDIQRRNEILEEMFHGAMLADGFEDALIGFGQRFNSPVAIYDYKKCIDILMGRDGMSEDEAVEFFDFNVVGAYVGDSTPVYIYERV